MSVVFVFVFAQSLGGGFSAGILTGPKPNNRVSKLPNSPKGRLNLMTSIVYLVRDGVLQHDDGVGVGRVR